jgi:hypothetical protein
MSPDPGISIHMVIEAIHSDRSRIDVVAGEAFGSLAHTGVGANALAANIPAKLSQLLRKSPLGDVLS